MRSAFVILLALGVASAAYADTPASPEVWTPVRVFIGTWSGTRTGAEATPKVVREYEAAANNQHLQIMERNGSKAGVWGMISFDSDRQRLTLLRFSPDGHTSLLALDPSASTESRLVFVGDENNPGRTRLTYERASWNEFVERMEYAPTGQEFTVVSEAHFQRKR